MLRTRVEELLGQPFSAVESQRERTPLTEVLKSWTTAKTEAVYVQLTPLSHLKEVPSPDHAQWEPKVATTKGGVATRHYWSKKSLMGCRLIFIPMGA